MFRQAQKYRQKLYYAMYKGNAETLDEYGDYTGEKTDRYSIPIQFLGNVSAAQGNAIDRPFGTELDYSKTLTTVDMGLPINEQSVIWFETAPPAGVNDGSTADYTVVGVARSLNNVRYALKAVVHNA